MDVVAKTTDELDSQFSKNIKFGVINDGDPSAVWSLSFSDNHQLIFEKENKPLSFIGHRYSYDGKEKVNIGFGIKKDMYIATLNNEIVGC